MKERHEHGLPLPEALLNPEAFPERPQRVKLLETHISYLFFTGAHVYKVKKPVNLGFLDFSTPEKRLHFCQQEVLLNRRLAPEVYLGVVEVREQGGHYSIEGPGRVVDYAVKMRQLPQERSLRSLIRKGKIGVEDVERLALKLAGFHQQATATTRPDLGGLASTRQNIMENFHQTEKYLGITLAPESYQDLQAYSQAFLEVRADLVARRQEQGKVRDCHGDLHSAQIFLEDGQIHVLDCIEFNERFRYIDVANEVAFLAMDLDHLGRPDLAHGFVEAYIKHTGDLEIQKLLTFYKVYRAYVRGKVTSFRLDDPFLSPEEKERVVQEARSYFSLARSYLRPFWEGILFITCGLVGTGKTRVAQELASRQGLSYLSSDILRKQLAGIPLTEHRFEPFHQGIYSPEFSRRTYQRLLEEASSLLKMGRSVVLDASFSRRAQREEALALARERGVSLWVLECRTPREVALARLERRQHQEESPSDGRPEVYHRQLQEFEEVKEVPPGNHIVLDTSASPEEVFSSFLKRFYAQRIKEG